MFFKKTYTSIKYKVYLFALCFISANCAEYRVSYTGYNPQIGEKICNFKVDSNKIKSSFQKIEIYLKLPTITKPISVEDPQKSGLATPLDYYFLNRNCTTMELMNQFCRDGFEVPCGKHDLKLELTDSEGIVTKQISIELLEGKQGNLKISEGVMYETSKSNSP